MLAIKLQENAVDLPVFDEVIHTAVPSGPNVFESTIQKNPELADLRCLTKKNHKIRPALAEKSLGTLGGGNHFIELDRDSSKAPWMNVLWHISL